MVLRGFFFLWSFLVRHFATLSKIRNFLRPLIIFLKCSKAVWKYRRDYTEHHRSDESAQIQQSLKSYPPWLATFQSSKSTLSYEYFSHTRGAYLWRSWLVHSWIRWSTKRPNLKWNKTADFEETKPPILKEGQNRLSLKRIEAADSQDETNLRFVLIQTASFFSVCKNESLKIKASWYHYWLLESKLPIYY